MWVHRKALRLGKRERFISSGRLFFIADPNRVIGHRCKFIIHARPRNRDNIFFRNEVDLIILFDWPFPFVVSISAICRVNWAKRDCRGCWKKKGFQLCSIDRNHFIGKWLVAPASVPYTPDFSRKSHFLSKLMQNCSRKLIFLIHLLD